jgi:N-acetylneuraminic acid mutarotase
MKPLWTLMLLLFCGGLQAEAAAVNWQTLAPMPLAVQEIYPAAHNGKIYVAGGLSDALTEAAQQMTDAVQVYDPATDRWTFGPALPEPRHHAYLVSVDAKLYVFGGFIAANGGRWSASAAVLQLDEQQRRWRQVATLPKPLTETVAVVVNGKVHLASGRSPRSDSNAQWRDQADVNWHWLFDPQTLSVIEAPALPQALNSAAGVSWNNEFYLLGGRQVGGDNLAAFYRYNPADARWRSLAPLPQAQGGLSAALLNDTLLVFGGEYFTAGGGVYRQVWQYQPDSDSWLQLGEMPLPRHGLGAVSLNNTIYVLGGATVAGLNATSNVLEAVSLAGPN